MEPQKKHLKVFGYGLAVICVWISFKLRHQPGIVGIHFLLGALAAGLTILTTWQHQRLLPFYRRWMKVAHAIGQVVSTVLLSLIFYLIFGAVGIVLRILRKDILDQKQDAALTSYWNQRDRQEFVKERYRQQF